MSRPTAISTWLNACLMLSAVSSALAQTSDPTPAQQAVQEVFAGGPSVPWYDPATDKLQEVELRDRADPPSPSEWVREPRPQPSQSNSNWNWNFDSFWELFQKLMWVLLAVLAIFAIWMLIRLYLQSDAWKTLDRANPAGVEDGLADVERMENLPVDLETDLADLLAAARRRYELGKYGEAIVFLFSYQLVELDRHHLLHLVKGKTNRQYLRELADRRELRQLISETMLAFEDFFFGQHPIAAERFEACWTRVDRFHELLAVEPTS